MGEERWYQERPEEQAEGYQNLCESTLLKE